LRMRARPIKSPIIEYGLGRRRGKIGVHATVGYDSNRDRHPVMFRIVKIAVMPGFVNGCGIDVRSMCTRCASYVREKGGCQCARTHIDFCTWAFIGAVMGV